MRVEIVAVGSELLTASRLETNSLLIAKRVAELGFRVMRKMVVEDLEEEIQSAVAASLAKADAVFLVGGLGPTSDDLTREAVSAALGRTLKPDSAVLERLRARYGRLGLQLGENSIRQAMVPEGAVVIDNPNGTAPGLFLEEAGKLLFLLPGPPSELSAMMDDVLALMRMRRPTAAPSFRLLKVASLAESALDLQIASIYKSYQDVQTTILASPGVIELYFNWIGDAGDESSERALDELVARVVGELREAVFTSSEESLETVVGRLLCEKGHTVATAESCTGGLIGKMLTDVPGSSRYYRGGVVCYHNDLKAALLGVSEASLETAGAVSAEVAVEMAAGVKRLTSADFGISATGIAGPEGGSGEKPVGLVFIGLAGPDGTAVKRLHLVPPREAIRTRASRFALDLLRRSLSVGGRPVD